MALQTSNFYIGVDGDACSNDLCPFSLQCPTHFDSGVLLEKTTKQHCELLF